MTVAFTRTRTFWGPGHDIVVGAKFSQDSQILSEIVSQVIEHRTPYRVKRRFNLEGSAMAFHAIMSGGVDMYVEYTGTALAEILKSPSIVDPEKGFETIREEFLSRFDLIACPLLGSSNAYVFVTRGDSPLNTIADMASSLETLKVGLDPEFANRSEADNIAHHYHFVPSFNPVIMEHTLLYVSLTRGALDVISGYEADSFISASNIKILSDKKGILPSYESFPVVRAATLKHCPQLRGVFSDLSKAISSDDVSALSAQLEKKDKNLYDCVSKLLKEKKIIDD